MFGIGMELAAMVYGLLAMMWMMVQVKSKKYRMTDDVISYRVYVCRAQSHNYFTPLAMFSTISPR